MFLLTRDLHDEVLAYNNIFIRKHKYVITHYIIASLIYKSYLLSWLTSCTESDITGVYYDGTKIPRIQLLRHELIIFLILVKFRCGYKSIFFRIQIVLI